MSSFIQNVSRNTVNCIATRYKLVQDWVRVTFSFPLQTDTLAHPATVQCVPRHFHRYKSSRIWKGPSTPIWKGIKYRISLKSSSESWIFLVIRLTDIIYCEANSRFPNFEKRDKTHDVYTSYISLCESVCNSAKSFN
jgi:hypothetical protein